MCCDHLPGSDSSLINYYEMLMQANAIYYMLAIIITCKNLIAL